jgi:type I restriction enzyme M protein
LGEAVETAVEVAGYEPEENEKVTASVIKKALKDLIGDLKGSSSPSALRELADLQAQERGILVIEQRIKNAKTKAKVKGDELALKLQLKRLGAAEFKAENEILLEQVLSQLVVLDPNDKTDKKKITALEKDRAVIQGRLAETDRLMATIGGQLTEAEARRLILQKLYDIAQAELTRYLNAERRILLAALENLWDKYAVSSRQLEAQRSQTLTELNQFLVKLSYINEA